MTKPVIGTLLPLLLAGVLGLAPAAIAQETTQKGTWHGMVEDHGDHFDYVGSPCPVQADYCIQVIVNYRIVPLTRQAAMALPRVAGKTAKLTGELDSTGDGEHQGTLYVRRVTG